MVGSKTCRPGNMNGRNGPGAPQGGRPQGKGVARARAAAAGAGALGEGSEEGPAGNGEGRLGRGVGERRRARPATRREHHGAADQVSSGTWAASRDRTDSSS